MDTWTLLKKELNYYGVDLIDSKKCQIMFNDQIRVQGVIKTMKQINSLVKQQKKILLSLWKEVVDLLKEDSILNNIIDDKMINLFVFSLKDMIKFLLCFEDCEKSIYYKIISNSLTRDINTFSKYQIYKLSDYKISIDWVSRLISKLLYITKLLGLASMGKKRVSKHEIKIARGISGPWAHLDLPMEERVFPFGQELQQREKSRQKQRRYRQGLENYNNDGRVGEGFYWRELRNEPFAWADRNFDDPYPSRNLLSR